MDEIEIIKTRITAAKEASVPPLVTAGGVIDSKTDLALADGKTIGDLIPGGIKSLKGRYAVDATGQIERVE